MARLDSLAANWHHGDVTSALQHSHCCVGTVHRSCFLTLSRTPQRLTFGQWDASLARCLAGSHCAPARTTWTSCASSSNSWACPLTGRWSVLSMRKPGTTSETSSGRSRCVFMLAHCMCSYICAKNMLLQHRMCPDAMYRVLQCMPRSYCCCAWCQQKQRQHQTVFRVCLHSSLPGSSPS